MAPADFDPSGVRSKADPESISWVDLDGSPSPPPDLESLPAPDDVLRGSALPDFQGLRLRSQNSFVCGNLHNFVGTWDRYMGGIPGYPHIRPWLVNGIHIPGTNVVFAK